ncbi:MAG: hypothetical protein JWN34_595, partial [Bryobacterales bacterium]|nr:hypothetical protein [Bryobacterales bacterium]
RALDQYEQPAAFTEYQPHEPDVFRSNVSIRLAYTSEVAYGGRERCQQTAKNGLIYFEETSRVWGPRNVNRRELFEGGCPSPLQARRAGDDSADFVVSQQPLETAEVLGIHPKKEIAVSVSDLLQSVAIVGWLIHCLRSKARPSWNCRGVPCCIVVPDAHPPSAVRGFRKLAGGGT